MNHIWMLIVACGINSGDCHHHKMALYFRDQEACIRYHNTSDGLTKCRRINRYVPLRDLTDAPGEHGIPYGDPSGQSAGG
jgi:hypothetical protein